MHQLLLLVHKAVTSQNEAYSDAEDRKGSDQEVKGIDKGSDEEGKDGAEEVKGSDKGDNTNDGRPQEGHLLLPVSPSRELTVKVCS